MQREGHQKTPEEVEHLQTERRHRRHEKHHTEGIDGWFRYGPNENLPMNKGRSGPNGCWFNESTGEVKRFKPAEECEWKMYAPKDRVAGELVSGPRGGDFDLKTNQLHEPEHPSSERYSGLYM
ncbi:hypothetical protein GEMRC1_011608 [Eukaryota sp. GEM-RC1]